jgi:dTDP-4-dehydrorhamnose 3,5-epimerase
MSEKRMFEMADIQVVDIQKIVDERGFFAEAIRRDWHYLFGERWVSQANISYSHPGIIRAWHRHKRGQIDFFMVLQGSMKIVAYDDNQESKTYGKMTEIFVSEERLQLVKIPGRYWHGTKTIGCKPSCTIYFVNNMYDYRSPDEERRPWNDSLIIDPTTKQSYDWNKPPHK